MHWSVTLLYGNPRIFHGKKQFHVLLFKSETHLRERNSCLSVQCWLYSVFNGPGHSWAFLCHLYYGCLFGGSLRDYTYFWALDLRVVPSVRFTVLWTKQIAVGRRCCRGGRPHLPTCQISCIPLGHLVGRDDLSQAACISTYLKQSIKVILQLTFDIIPSYLEFGLTGRIRMIPKCEESKEF